MKCFATMATLVLVLGAAGQLWAEPPADPADAAHAEFFELKIRPLLVEKCVDCHTGDDDAESTLAINSRQALVEGGDFGPAVIPGRADDSLLIQATKRVHKELQMPPDEGDALTQQEVALLARWINEGAVWPGKQTRDDDRNDSATIDRLPSTDHWSFQPRRVVLPPEPDDARWAHTQIDRFVEAARRGNGLVALGEADRRTLIRRATFDLTGLPPTPAEVAAFIRDPDDLDAALARVVDRLLASKHYGQRQGRQWLDVARYADTQGDVGDFPIPAAYRYRDWVIDAANRDMPFDEFVRAQIAGDVLARGVDDAETARELVVATGFVALARRFGNKKKDSMPLTIEDTIDTLGRGVLGLTLRCARCHNHKFDPILASDYYGLYGIFDSTVYPWMGMSDEKSPSDLSPVLPDAESRAKAGAYWALISRYEYQINNHFRPWLKPTLDEFRSVADEIARLRDENGDDAPELAALEKKRDELLARHDGKFRELMLHDLNWIKNEKKRLAENPPVEFVFAVSEGRPHDARLHRRGNPDRPGPVVPRRFLRVLAAEPPKIESGSGRLELARWLTRDDHPLTARVIVNRVWQQHFGRGIVATPDNFGVQGARPSHPELLDWLAEQFVRDGWSLKKLHRRIMLSRTYRLASTPGAAADAGSASSAADTSLQSPEALDPDNIYLWKFARRRLDAEEIRDAVLATSGRLDTSPAGPHPFKPWYAARFSLNSPFHAEYPTNHRSVYLMTQRLFAHPFLGLFDGPDTSSSTSKRGATNIPSQALFLMNSAFVKEQAEALADRLAAETEDAPSRVARLYQLAYGRDPAPGEREAVRGFLDRYESAARAADETSDAEHQALVALCRAVLTSNEFFFVD